MAILLTKIRGRVRNKIRDMDNREGGPSVLEVDMAICDAYLALAAELPQPILYTASALTISANQSFFSLPVTVTSSGYGTGTVEYAGLVDLILVSDGRKLRRNTLDELESFLNNNASTVTGRPDRFALYEDGSQVVRGRCYPGAAAAEVCNMYSSLQVDDLRDWVGTGGAEGLDTVSANLSRLGAAALVDYTAGMIVAGMTKADLDARGLDGGVAKLWLQEAGDLLYQEAAHRNALVSNGQTQRRVS